MALYKTEAVVIGARNWGEADKMMTFFTLERGILEAAAFGCRRPRSPLAGGMQLFAHLEVQLAEGRRVDTVKQCMQLGHCKKIGEDLQVMAYGAFVAEFLREFMPAGTPEPKAFACLLEVLGAFEERHPRVTALAAVLQLLEFTGLQLRYEHCVHCGSAVVGDAAFAASEGGVLCGDCSKDCNAQPFPKELRQLVLNLRDMDWQSAPGFSVSGRTLVQAESLLLNYLQNLLGKPLKSLEFIQQM